VPIVGYLSSLIKFAKAVAHLLRRHLRINHRLNLTDNARGTA
jgi:hypothetical protein